MYLDYYARLMYVVQRMLYIVRHVLFVVCRTSYDVRRILYVLGVRRTLYDVRSKSYNPRTLYGARLKTIILVDISA